MRIPSLKEVFNKHTAMSAVFTGLNTVFAIVAAPSLFALLPAACAVYSAHQWKQIVTGRGFW